MDLRKILKEQEQLNVEGKHSVVDAETGELLHLLVKLKTPKNVLEVGTSIGYSTLWLASALNKNAKLITIERWKERANMAKQFFKRAKLNIELIEGDALQIIPNLKKKFDFIFLDATKAEYLKYLKLVKLNKHAVVVADNTIYPIDRAAKAKDFVDYVTKKGAITLNIGKGLTILYT